MLEVTVTDQATQQTVVVRVNAYDSLTPQAAKAARSIAFPGGNVTVSDGEIAYRVTKSGARLIN